MNKRIFSPRCLNALCWARPNLNAVSLAIIRDGIFCARARGTLATPDLRSRRKQWPRDLAVLLILGAALLSFALPVIPALAATPGETAASLMLAREFHGQDVAGWAMSEKLDGVRGFWDGRRLVSRGGHVFDAPPGFTRNFPPFALDGELFGGRGTFEKTSAAVRSAGGDWRGIRLHVFDVPHAEGGLYARLQQAKDWLAAHPDCGFVVIEQRPVASLDAARRFLREVEAQGGEGIVLRDPALPYQAGRSAGFLKWKSRFDEECAVVAHHPGKGKYAGLMGAVSCENHRGRFRIGTGWKDADRRDPPPLGTVITYRYQGFTAKGLPRFPSYLRRARGE